MTEAAAFSPRLQNKQQSKLIGLDLQRIGERFDPQILAHQWMKIRINGYLPLRRHPERRGCIMADVRGRQAQDFDDHVERFLIARIARKTVPPLTRRTWNFVAANL